MLEINQIATEQNIQQNPFMTEGTKKAANVYDMASFDFFPVLSKEKLNYLNKFAKNENANLIEESLKITDNDVTHFDIEKETPDKRGMEVISYSIDNLGQTTLKKRVFLEYTNKSNEANQYCFDSKGMFFHSNIDNKGNKSTKRFVSPMQLKEISNEKYELQGAMNVLNALFENTNDTQFIELFKPKQELLRTQLENLDNFFESKNV